MNKQNTTKSNDVYEKHYQETLKDCEEKFGQ